MAARKSNLQSAYNESRRTGDWKPFFAAMAAAIRNAETSKDLDALFRSAPCVEGVFDEGSYDPAIADALVERAGADREGDVACAALGWAVRATAFYPYSHLEPTRPAVKQAFLDALSRHRKTFAAGLTGTSAAKRSAYGYALGVVDGTAGALNALVAGESSTARASYLVARAALQRRAGEAPDAQVAAIARKLLSDRASLGGLAAALYLAATDDVVPVLTEHIATPKPLPAEWGWYWTKPKSWKSDTFAVAAARFVRATDTQALLSAIASIEPVDAGHALLIADAMMHLAFTARGRPLPREGITRADVDPTVRVLLEWVAKANGAQERVLSALGFYKASPESVAPFLQGEAPEWKPIAVRTSQGERRYHLARIYLAVAQGEVSLDDAVAAVTSEVPADTLAALILMKSTYFAGADERLVDESERARAFQLLFALALRLDDSKPGTLAAAVERAADDVWSYRAEVLLPALLERHPPKSFDAKMTPLIENALMDAPTREPLAALLQRHVPVDVLEKVLMQGYSVKFFDLALTPRTLEKLFRIIQEFPASEADAEAVLRRTLPSSRALLEGYRSDDPKRHALGRAVIDRVLGS